VIAASPIIVGTDAITAVFGVDRRTVYSWLQRTDSMIQRGYLGLIGNRHAWNAAELFNGLFTSDESLRRFLVDGQFKMSGNCVVDDCAGLGGPLGMCHRHALRFMRSWEQAEFSSAALIQFVAMCRWVVERWSHVVLPDFDPWSPVCATPDCDGDANVGGLGALCRECTTALVGHLTAAP
jgi:hypothetical protein